MVDYLVEQNRDRLEGKFEEYGIDPLPDSRDMIFIKELIYGGPLPGQVLTGNETYV